MLKINPHYIYRGVIKDSKHKNVKELDWRLTDVSALEDLNRALHQLYTEYGKGTINYYNGTDCITVCDDNGALYFGIIEKIWVR
jgi:hypothetical protein